MNAMMFLVGTLFDLYLMVVILRLWLQLARADFYNPFSQFVVKATHPLVAPLRRVFPSFGGLDTATLVLAFVVAALKIIALMSIAGAGLPPVLSLLLTSLVMVFKEAVQLLFWVLIIRAILSWISQGHSPVERVMAQLTEPVLAPIRRVIPPIGGLDLSVLIAILGLQFIQILIGDLF